MKKICSVVLFVVLLIVFSNCKNQTGRPNAPDTQPFAATTPEPISPDPADDASVIDVNAIQQQEKINIPSTPYPLGSVEEAAYIYARFLRSEIPGHLNDGSKFWTGDRRPCLDDNAFDNFFVRDLTGDGVPELCSFGSGYGCYIWTIENGCITYLASLGSWTRLLPIGAIFYHRPGVAGMDHIYHYMGISPESKQYPDISYSAIDTNNDGVLDSFHINGEVSKEIWDEITSVYFALSTAEPAEDDMPVAFSKWTNMLDNFELPPVASINAEVVESDKGYRIVAIYSGESEIPDRSYTLLLEDYHGKNPLHTFGYGDNYPLVRFVSENILQITKNAGAGTTDVWFFSIIHGVLSPAFYSYPGNPVLSQGWTVISSPYTWEYGKFVLEVSDMFHPDIYTEIFELDFAPNQNDEDRIIGAALDGRKLTVTYIGGEDRELIQAELILGKNLPSWLTESYDYIEDKKTERISIIDFDLNGIPELCSGFCGNHFGGIAYAYARTQSGISEIPLWASLLFLLTDIQSGEIRWLTVGHWKDGAPHEYSTYNLHDLSDPGTPKMVEKLYVDYCGYLSGDRVITVRVDGAETVLSEEETAAFIELKNSSDFFGAGHGTSFEQELWQELKLQYHVEPVVYDMIFIGHLNLPFGNGTQLSFSSFVARLYG